MCYLDLSKAFERVCLKALYTTYFDKGVRCRALRFLRAWIHPRQQHVKIGTEYSTRNALTSGVFQGRLRNFIQFVYAEISPRTLTPPTENAKISNSKLITVFVSIGRPARNMKDRIKPQAQKK